MHLIKLSVLCLSALLMSACSTPYPLGMNEEQWSVLTLNERQELLFRQQATDERLRLARIKSQELQLKKELEEEKRITYAYKHPKHGNVIMVNILGGSFINNKKTKNIVEESYIVARGETKQIKLKLEDRKKHYISSKTAYLKYDIQGNAVYLSFRNLKHSNNKRIALLRNGKWDCGSRYKKQLHDSYNKLVNVKFFVKENASSCNKHVRRTHNY